MRLLQLNNDDGDEFSLVEFLDRDVPPYSILSHTWGSNGSEVTYQDILKGTGKSKAGYKKIRACGMQTAKDNMMYFWVDTCCIDKTSSAELSEAINSMYRWYQDAVVCYAYLEDVPPDLSILAWSAATIRWFTRGWTLQELLAPREVIFFANDWSMVGQRTQCAGHLSAITRIHLDAFQDKSIRSFSIAQRMSWAAERITTRSEDIAYCLLGLFGVNMPLLYGEGQAKAFVRLQEEIMKESNDHSLFAWCDPSAAETELRSLLAESPTYFAASSSVVPSRMDGTSRTYAMTNAGLQITLPMARIPQTFNSSIASWQRKRFIGLLDCKSRTASDYGGMIVLALFRLPGEKDQYGRINTHRLDLQLPKRDYWCSNQRVYVPKYFTRHLCSSRSEQTPLTCEETFNPYGLDFGGKSDATRQVYGSDVRLFTSRSDKSTWRWNLEVGIRERPYGYVMVHSLILPALFFTHTPKRSFEARTSRDLRVHCWSALVTIAIPAIILSVRKLPGCSPAFCHCVIVQLSFCGRFIEAWFYEGASWWYLTQLVLFGCFFVYAYKENRLAYLEPELHSALVFLMYLFFEVNTLCYGFVPYSAHMRLWKSWN
ncbi:hypothetical protein E8E12_009799 [Didymella heteroderae]|uniref:Heterokaryon incompatibility domain-containing protein n=1 Tax=Didymella heteroderae TaxID=1769908 RepID=A0A9P4WVW3_9PLEO|nr:hypothetical protein E8E12_009799 [Didymella heteroderae]